MKTDDQLFFTDTVDDSTPQGIARCAALHLALTVPEAPLLVRQHAHYVTRAGGGRGAVREACELIMHAQGTLDARLQSYLK